MNVSLKVKNITPLLQIEGIAKERIKYLGNTEVDTTTQKTIVKLIDGIPVEIPVYSANGIRGLLRRVASSILVEKYLEKGNTIKPADFHLMFAGGGSNFQSQPFEVEEKVRELNPVISLFGTSLAIEGKLMVTYLEPENPLIRIYENEDGIFAKSQILQKFVFIKKDDILQKTKYGRFLTKEDIKEWEKTVLETQEQRKKERSSENENKTKKVAIQSILAKYYIVPNTVFKGFISYKYPLTEIERGLLIKTLERAVYEQLGSTLNLGFGVCDWEINIGNESKIIAKSKDENIFAKDLSVVLSDEDEKSVEEFEKWLEGIDKKNIEISKVLVSN
jgi:CRISPR type IV-associated protein Csf2